MKFYLTFYTKFWKIYFLYKIFIQWLCKITHKSTEPFEKKEVRLIKNLHDLLDDNIKFANMSKKIILFFVSTIELLNEEEKKKKNIVFL